MKHSNKPIFFTMATLIALQASAALGSETLTVSHFSDSLGRRVAFNVLVPEDLSGPNRSPVVYLLHGAYGNYANWVDNTNVEQIAEEYGMIIVMPDGGPFGWYLDSPIDATSAYESYITQELVSTIDSLFPTLPSREARGICGLSMGGHGALSLAAKHPEVFSSASSLSGILRITSHPDAWHIRDRLGPLEDHAETWAASCVYDLAPQFAGSDVEILFDVGLQDQTGAVLDNQQCHEKLDQLGIQHTYREYPGTHSWEYWETHLPEHLDFHAENFSKRLGRPISAKQKKERDGLDKWHKHYLNRLERFREENERLKALFPDRKTIVLVGSSSVEHFNEAELMPGYLVLDRGISADRIGLTDRGILHRLNESVFDCNPAYVFILNGRNDLGQTMREGKPLVTEVAACYRKVVERIQEGVPDAKVCIVSCFPTRNHYEAMAPLVREYDAALQTIASDLGVDYLDVYSRLVGKDGLLEPEYSMPDGLHVTGPAYRIWAEMMIEFLSQDHE